MINAPKEKALELANKMYSGNPMVYTKQEHLNELVNSKIRALICVKEITESFEQYEDKQSGEIDICLELSYWDTVKKEIEKL